MEIVIKLIYFISVILFLLGLFLPEKSLWWYNKEKTRIFSAKFYATIFISMAILGGILYPKKNNKTETEELSKLTDKIEQKASSNYSNVDESSIKNSDKIVHYDIDGNRIGVTKKEISEKDIDRQFSSWDGSHMNLVKAVKKAMNDPRSYEHVQTTYLRKDKVLFIKMDYRGKNGFGALVKTSVLGQADAATGEIISVNNID